MKTEGASPAPYVSWSILGEAIPLSPYNGVG